MEGCGERGKEWEEAERGRRRRLRRKREEGQGSPGGEEAQDAKGDKRVRWSFPADKRPSFGFLSRASHTETRKGGRDVYVGRQRSSTRHRCLTSGALEGWPSRSRPYLEPFMATGGGGWKSWNWRRPL